MSLTSRELDLTSIYHCGNRAATLAQVREALPQIDAPDVRAEAARLITKLAAMSDGAFVALPLEPEATPLGAAGP